MHRRYLSILTLCLPLSLTPAAWGFDHYQPLPTQLPLPADNPPTAAKAALGARLFFDTRLLGADSPLSCDSCHTLAHGGSDGQARSHGQHGRLTYRNAPTLWNIGFQTVLYWDGRAPSLEGQLLDHLRDPQISRAPNLGTTVDWLLADAGYRRDFAAAFPGDDPVTGDNLARALASFLRSLLTPDSPFDRYLGGERSALSASARRGMQIFRDIGCLSCHFGVNLAGPAPGPAMGLGDGFYELFPNTLGSAYDRRYRLADDQGRFEYTGNPWERYMWRVPILRNIAETAPYFHNGSVATLEEAVRVMAKTQLRLDLPIRDVDDIAAFLRSLTGRMSLPAGLAPPGSGK